MLFPIKQEFKQTFYHFSLWEDWKNGFYETSKCENKSIQSKDVLSNESRCFDSMNRVITQWPYSSVQNLTNLSINRRAWLGQASCLLEVQSNHIQTINGWNLMPQKHQAMANYIADQIIHLFEMKFMDGEYA
jgi:hypothetical protein